MYPWGICTIVQAFHRGLHRVRFTFATSKLPYESQHWDQRDDKLICEPAWSMIPAPDWSLRVGKRVCLQMVWVAELIDQPLTSLRLLHDPFLVVLSERSRQLVIVHRWSVLRKRSLKIKQKGLLGFIERRNFAFDQKNLLFLPPFSFPTEWRPWPSQRSWRFPSADRSSGCSCHRGWAGGGAPWRTATGGCWFLALTGSFGFPSPRPPHLKGCKREHESHCWSKCLVIVCPICTCLYLLTESCVHIDDASVKREKVQKKNPLQFCRPLWRGLRHQFDQISSPAGQYLLQRFVPPFIFPADAVNAPRVEKCTHTQKLSAYL